MKSSSQKVKRVRPILGTYVTIELQGQAEEKLLNEYITAGFEAIAEIDQRMSYYRLDSDLTRLNRAGLGEWIDVHATTGDVLEISNELFIFSGGVFDIRCGGVLAERGVLPSFSRIDYGQSMFDESTLPLEFCGSRVRKTGPWLLDLGGIAKGYAVDHAVKRIQCLSSGLDCSGVVNAGGDLRMWGDKSMPAAVRVYGKSSSWIRMFEGNRMAAATSSVRMHAVSAKRLSAAFHVRMPLGEILNEIKTVTVFADECIFADAMTKIVLLGSMQMAQQFLSFYKARALVFGPCGQFEKAIN